MELKFGFALMSRFGFLWPSMVTSWRGNFCSIERSFEGEIRTDGGPVMGAHL